MANVLQRIAARTLGLATRDDVQAIVESLIPGRDSFSEPGYTLVSGIGSSSADPSAIKEIQRDALFMWIKDPLIKQAVTIKRYFTLGAGITFTAEDPEVDQALHEFWRDETERMPQQLEEYFNSIGVSGELCLRFFGALDGSVRVRLIPTSEVSDVITDAEDRHVIKFIRRMYTRREFNAQSRSYSEQPVDELIPGDEVLWLAINKPPGWVRGISPLYAAIPWARAYSEWLQDRIKLNKAKGAWAWLRKVTGGPAAVAAGAAKLASDLGGKLKSAVSGEDPEKKAPPKAGGVINANQNVDWSVINAKVGADDAKEDGRALKLQVAAATNVFEHYFGDASVANLASAKAMELPMLREYEYMQGTLGWVIAQIFRRLLKAKVEAGRLAKNYQVTKETVTDGQVAEESVERITVDCPVDINWPPLKTEDRLDRTKAAQIEQLMGIKSDATIASEAGVEDWDQEKARLFKERQEREARRREDLSNEYPPFPSPPGGKPGSQQGGVNDGNAGGTGTQAGG